MSETLDGAASPRRGVVARYGKVLRQPAVGSAMAFSVVGRLHESMISFAVVLLVTERSTYAMAGLAMAAFGAGGIVAAPVNSRLAARFGHTPVLLVTAVAYAAAVAGMATADGGVPGLITVAVVAGLCTPPLTPALRSTLPRLVPDEQRLVAFAAESTLQEVVFVVGPVIAGAVACLVSAEAALLAAGAATVLGTSGYCLVLHGQPAAAAPSVAPGDPPLAADDSRPAHGGAPDRLFTGTVVRLLLGGVGFLTVLSLAGVAIVAEVSGPQAHGGAGVFLGLASAGSMVGGLAFGARADGTGGLQTRFRLLAVTLCCLVALAAMPLHAGQAAHAMVAGAAAFAYGTTIAPVATVLFALLDDATGVGRSPEAFGWMGAAMGIGGVIGDASGGWLVTARGPGLAAAAAAATAFAAAALFRRVPAAPG